MGKKRKKGKKSASVADTLTKAGIPFALHHLGSPNTGSHGPMETAAALEVDPGRVMTVTLALIDDKATMAVLPITEELDLAALAAAVGGTRSQVCGCEDVKRITGRGPRHATPLRRPGNAATIVDVHALDGRTVFVPTADPRVFVELKPDDLIRASNARTAPICRL